MSPPGFQKQAGNALFLILIGVALFAALGYAFTQSSRTSGGNTNRENADLHAAQILSYATTIEQAVARLLLLGGCDNTQISFENPVITGYDNPGAPSDKRCHVFDPDGAGVALRASWPSSMFDPTYAAVNSGGFLYGQPMFTAGADYSITVAGGTQSWPSGTTKDLAMIFPFLSLDVCAALNRMITGSAVIPWELSTYSSLGGGQNAKWRGDYALIAGSLIGQWSGGSLNGYRSGCFRGSDANPGPTPAAVPPTRSSGEYVFYDMLIIR